MSREIKFRAWDGAQILDMEHLIDKPMTFVDLLSSEYPTWKLMQYTGLKDKNGTEIYEGDIVSGSGLGVVEFSTRQLRCGFVINRGIFEKNVVDMPLNVPHETVIAVIGNIYENPELLEAKS